MSETKSLSLPTRAQLVFNILLSFYPLQYQKQFGREMRLLFADLYTEELTKNGNIRVTFWLSQIIDISKNIFIQHIALLQRGGLKKYLQQEGHFNKFNFFGFLLLLPFLTMIAIDLISRITQGDLSHYNHPVYYFLSHTFLYSYPVLFTWVILFPLIAIVLNIIPIIINSWKKRRSIFNYSFVTKNIISLTIICIGLGFISIVKLHDFAPCTIQEILKLGIGQFFHIISVCRNA